MKTSIVLFAFLASMTALAAPVTDVKVKALDGFSGDAGAVVSRCQTKVGAEYDPVTVTRDVNSLKAAKDFEDISADANSLPGGV